MSDDTYDVVCIGGAAIGSAVAYALTENPDFDGTVAVIEADPSYEFAQTSRAQNSIREQFSQPVNIKISQYGLDFLDNFHERTAVNGESPELNYRGTGYLFLADNHDALAVFAEQQQAQNAEGAMSRMLTPAQVQAEFPYLDVSQIVGARMGSMREGSFDGWALFQGYRRRAVHNGATYITDRVVDLTVTAGRVSHVVCESGRRLGAGWVVNAAGSRAALIAEMVGLALPVEPRARTSFVFDCRTPIEHNVPLTITPEGVHFRREQQHYMCGAVPEDDHAVDYDDCNVRPDEFDEQVWPALAKYVPAFDRISQVASWGGQYAYNTLDHNLIIGTAPEPANFVFANGFSGHGLQQSPATGRAVSELIIYGEYRTLDLTQLGYDRVLRNEPFYESLVI